MRTVNAFALRDLVATILAATLAAVLLLGMAPEPGQPPARTWENLRTISQAAHLYKLSNNNYLPLTLTYDPRGTSPRQGNVVRGWCTWSFGGKNTSAYWYNNSGGAFDVEAADRPLNAYLQADEPFYAPPFPLRLPVNDPARLNAQAEMCRDPGDTMTFQRNWPNGTPGVSGYDDVGTSYQTNMAWWNQLVQVPSFVQRFAEGARRIAQNKGVQPSRFVWLSDQYGGLLSSQLDPRFRIRNGYGEWNAAPMLFLDGHASYEYIRPTRLNTANYTFTFE